MASPLIAFYSGAAPDHRGRFLRDIQQWSDERLEAVHDYIQWLFPLPEPSPVNPLAPLLDRPAIEAFHAQPELRRSLGVSLARMLRFYGLELDSGPPPAVTRAENFAERARNWLWPGNHNHLRITRILKCVRLSGLESEARAFFECLTGIYEEERRKPRPEITAETFRFWSAAVGPAG